MKQSADIVYRIWRQIWLKISYNSFSDYLPVCFTVGGLSDILGGLVALATPGSATKHDAGVYTIIRSKTSEKQVEWQKFGDITSSGTWNFHWGQ